MTSTCLRLSHRFACDADRHRRKPRTTRSRPRTRSTISVPTRRTKTSNACSRARRSCFASSANWSRFGKPVRTRDYTLIPVYDDCGGSACGRSRTTLLIEKRQAETKIDRTLKRFCVACQAQVRGKAGANEISIALDRKDGQHFAPPFRNVAITISKQAARSEGAAVGRRLHLSVRGRARCLHRPSGRVPRRLSARPAGRQRPLDQRAWRTNYAAVPDRQGRQPHAKRPARRRRSRRALISTSRFAGGVWIPGPHSHVKQKSRAMPGVFHSIAHRAQCIAVPCRC